MVAMVYPGQRYRLWELSAMTVVGLGRLLSDARLHVLLRHTIRISIPAWRSTRCARKGVTAKSCSGGAENTYASAGGRSS